MNFYTPIFSSAHGCRSNNKGCVSLIGSTPGCHHSNSGSNPGILPNIVGTGTWSKKTRDEVRDTRKKKNITNQPLGHTKITEANRRTIICAQLQIVTYFCAIFFTNKLFFCLKIGRWNRPGSGDLKTTGTVSAKVVLKKNFIYRTKTRQNGI